MEEDLPSKWRLKRRNAGVAILVSDKIGFKPRKIRRDKELNYIMLRGSIQEKEPTIINICTPNKGVLRYIKKVLSDLQRDRLPHNSNGRL